MTALQKLELRSSELRKELSDLGALDTLNDEQRAKIDTLKTEYGDLETRRQALIIAGEVSEPEPVNDAEGREMRSLIDACNVGHIYHAAVNHSQTDGEVRELQEHLNLESNQIPLSLLETRDVTPGIDAETQVSDTIQPIFAMGVSGFLHIDKPTVPVGAASYPVLTTVATVGGPHADSTSVDETTGAFTANELKPLRLQASFFYRRVDRARFADMDSSLREALSSSLMEAHDKQILTNASTGLFTDSVVNATAHAGNAVTTFNQFLSKLAYDRVDGRFASMCSEVKALIGSDTYALMGSTYQSTPFNSVAQLVEDKLGGMQVSDLVPDTASKAQYAMIRRGSRRDAVSPIWEGVTLIPDEITKAATGEIVITAVMMYNFKVLRKGGFNRVQIRITA